MRSYQHPQGPTGSKQLILPPVVSLPWGDPGTTKPGGSFGEVAAPRLPATTTRHCRKKLMCHGPPFAEGIVFISLCLPLLRIICPLCAMIPAKTSTLQPRPEPRSLTSCKQHPRHGTQTPQVQGSRCLSDMPIFALLLRGLNQNPLPSH